MTTRYSGIFGLSIQMYSAPPNIEFYRIFRCLLPSCVYLAGLEWSLFSLCPLAAKAISCFLTQEGEKGEKLVTWKESKSEYECSVL